MEDKELYQKFLNGEKEALDELIRKYRTEIVKFIQQLVGDYHSAEDISQEVFVYLLQHKEVYKFEFSFRTYLYTIAKSRAYNYLKKRKKVDFIEDNQDKIFAEIQDVEDEAIKNDKAIMVRKAIRKLKKQYQVAIYLIDLNEMSYEETGLILGKSVSQIKALIHNARKRLKGILEEEREKEVEHNEINGEIHK